MISVEPLVVQIRAIRDGGRFGDPFTWAATGVRIGPGVLEIVGAMNSPAPSVWREMRRTLREQGWDRVVFRRMRRGKCEMHEVELRHEWA